MKVLFDIDGFIIDSSFRNEHVEVDFERYLALHTTDKPILQGVMTASLYMGIATIEPIFITTRGEVQRENTQALLESIFDHSNFELWMRKAGDDRKDVEVKRDLLAEHDVQPEDVFIAFDDRPVIIDLYRSMGIVAYQVAEGY